MAIEKKRAEKLIQENFPYLYKFCAMRVRDRDLALDICQNTLLVFWNKRETLDDKNIKAWLTTAAARIIADEQKIQARHARIEKQTVIEDTAVFDDFSGITDESELMLSEVQKRILNLLTEEEKRLFIKLFIEKRDIHIFAEEENISLEAARMRKNRLKTKAKNLYKNTYFLLAVLSFKFFG